MRLSLRARATVAAVVLFGVTLAVASVLLVSTLVVAATTIFLPYTPLGTLFGFVPLPPLFLLLLLAITAAYLVASELVKGWFFRR